jgi:hypothetical protein
MTINDVSTETGRTLERIVDRSAVVTPTAQSTTPAETASRPSWLPDGCPPWCEMGPLHKDIDYLDDRVHSGSSVHITLTAEEPPLGPGVTPDGKGRIERSVPYDDPATADVHLQQHYREATPRVWVGRNESRIGMYLTLNEAERLAHEILKRAAAGRLAQSPGNSRAGCPIWCVDDHASALDDNEHMSEIYGVELAAHPYTVSVTSGERETHHAAMLASITIDDGEPPFIAVTGHDDKPGSRLTPDEADQLADTLHTLAATLRGAQESQPSSP